MSISDAIGGGLISGASSLLGGFMTNEASKILLQAITLHLLNLLILRISVRWRILRPQALIYFYPPMVADLLFRI